MEFKKGERVRHPNKPECGIGQVLKNSAGDTVSILFVDAENKPRSLNLSTGV